jgi:hypothetical protein
MIGHALLMFSPEEEDRVLMGKLMDRFVLDEFYEGRGCLLQVASGNVRAARFSLWDRDVSHTVKGEDTLFPLPLTAEDCRTRNRWAAEHGSIGHRYDALCGRFGVERIANAIRMRILANQAQRELTRQIEATV